MGFALTFHGPSEAKGRDPDGNPSQLVGDSDDVLKPRPELTGSNEACTEAETADGAGGKNCDPWNLVSIQCAEELWGVVVNG